MSSAAFFTSGAVNTAAWTRHDCTHQNAYVERYNGTVRYNWPAITCSTRSSKCRTTLRNDYEPSIEDGPTWPSAVLFQTEVGLGGLASAFYTNKNEVYSVM
jgi:hypothetical protein